MPRSLGPERAHFGGEGGLISETSLGRTRYFWRCAYCNWEMGGKNFQNNKARIHLSGDPNLRNGLVSRVCHSAPNNIKQQFSAIERSKRDNKRRASAKRRRAKELLGTVKTERTTPTKQSRLAYKGCTNEEVDRLWGEAFFGCDIPVRKIAHPLFRNAIAATQRSKSG